MYDPSEAAQDRVRRRCMNVGFIIILLLSFAQWHFVGVSGWDWVSILLLAVAAAPLAMAVKVFELRFKMATQERRTALSEIPRTKKVQFAAYAVLALITGLLNVPQLCWALWGIWLYDFVSYYHDRPERLRHLYAVTKTLDELRSFRSPWAWTLPSILFEVYERFWFS